jgi:rRNA maturation endonuclease Nob1
MGLCQHCGKHFPALSGDECVKCKRLLDPEATDFKKKEIKVAFNWFMRWGFIRDDSDAPPPQGYPQCNGCGVVYQLMEGDVCGICKVKAGA